MAGTTPAPTILFYPLKSVPGFYSIYSPYSIYLLWSSAYAPAAISYTANALTFAPFSS